MSKNRRGITLEKKLAAYTLAGAAALMAPGAAKADVVYFPNVDTTVNQPDSYDFNLSGASSDDITISANESPFSSGAFQVVASTGPGAEILLDDPTPGANVAALAFGALIDPTNSTNWGSSGKMASNFPPEPGDWPSDGGDAYLGFYFQGTSGPQAGWADIATTTSDTSSSFEVLSYAYQSDPNTPINAGQVPEPSALPLLILGGAGLIALRRRRAAHA
jgi:PEP-CTERM motif